ncbi:MAG: hypothetical protein SFX18_17020 [Pirellulales bacterium]|nr:hypothetical protein [Pirellulales bacterium]
MASIPATSGPQPINEAQRRRLQSWFLHGKEKHDAGSFDYAADLYIQCVKGDPANLEYLRAYLQNLYKKYKNNRKGASFGGFQGGSHKANLKKALSAKDWKGALDNGLEVLRINPWDAQILLQIAQAVGELQCYDAQLGYLKAAFDAAPKDAEVAKACAKALAYLGDFDQAIVMWHKVEELRPNDAEAPREISNLQRDKILGVAPKRPAAAGPPAGSKGTPPAEEATKGSPEQPQIKLTPTQELQKKIAEFPQDLENYFQLADIYVHEDKFAEADRLLRTALDLTGRDLKVQEKLEDVDLKRSRHQVQIAEQRAAKDGGDAAKALAKNLKDELNRKELEVYRVRADRYPTVPRWKFELGLRVKKTSNFHEAAKIFEEIQEDPERGGLALLELGECLQQMQKFQPALEKYLLAVGKIPEKLLDIRKLALYRTGVLAMGLKAWDVAERHLTQLAGLDFKYKDVAERLDKLQQMRHKG